MIAKPDALSYLENGEPSRQRKNVRKQKQREDLLPLTSKKSK